MVRKSSLDIIIDEESKIEKNIILNHNDVFNNKNIINGHSDSDDNSIDIVKMIDNTNNNINIIGEIKEERDFFFEDE